MKKIFVIILVLLIAALGFVVYKFNFKNDDVFIKNNEGRIQQINIHDGTYKIAGQNVVLKNGISEVPAAPGSASKVTTKYFGNDLKIDLNKDGVDDLVFIISQETGGSGVFYYVVGLLDTREGKIGTDAVLLGDRIAPQTIGFDEGKTTLGTNRQGVIVVNYADRNKGEDFSVSPTLGKSLWLKLDLKTMQWGEVAQNFEGEADSAKMTLSMKTWNWINTLYNDGKIVKPLRDKFSITFNKDKTFKATTDCNGIGGEYSVSGNKITFSKMISTMMYCDGSQEGEFNKMLNETGSYMFTPKGELILLLKFDSGSVTFK